MSPPHLESWPQVFPVADVLLQGRQERLVVSVSSVLRLKSAKTTMSSAWGPAERTTATGKKTTGVLVSKKLRQGRNKSRLPQIKFGCGPRKQQIHCNGRVWVETECVSLVPTRRSGHRKTFFLPWHSVQ